MSVNFPFIFLGVMQLSLEQTVALAALSVFAQCNFRVQAMFTVVQTAFNVANAVNATAAAFWVYRAMLALHFSAAPALSVAAAAYFLSNTLPLATVMGWTKNEKVLRLWSETFSWYLPFYLVGAALSALADFLSLHYGWATSLLVAPIAYTIYRSYNGQVARLRDRQQHIADMEALHLRAIEGLAMAIEAKDSGTHDHLTRVRVYVSEIGQALRLSPPEMQAVLTAATLHDIGKLAVPEYIINKPGKLTQDEFEKMKIHPVVGADILERVDFPYPVVPIVRAHHEWWNGMGYPDGLRGADIPIGARILTVVDCFDALASDRPYRRAMSLPQAMAVVREMAGTQFDPAVVDALEQRYLAIEQLARREGERLKRLDTDVAVKRGLAPGAGFAQEHGGTAEPAAKGTSPALGHVLQAEEWDEVLERMRGLLRMSRSPDYTLSPQETAAVLASRLRPVLPFDCFVLYSKDGDTLVPEAVSPEAAPFFSNRNVLSGEGISGWVALSGRPIVNGNPSVEPHFTGNAAELRSALAIPLLGSDGAILGVFSFYAKAENAFSREQLRVLEAVAPDFFLSLETIKAFREDKGERDRTPKPPEAASEFSSGAPEHAPGSRLTSPSEPVHQAMPLAARTMSADETLPAGLHSPYMTGVAEANRHSSRHLELA